jgi:hypothetical protein
LADCAAVLSSGGAYTNPVTGERIVFRPAESIYITLNEVNPALFARAANRLQEWAEDTTADHHILRRRWILVDADPVRPKGISSTKEELKDARAVTQKIARFLRDEYGFSSLVTAISGNGGHLLIPVDMPNTEATRDLVKRFLGALAQEFDTKTVTIDQAVFNAGRVSKLYGTAARKGDNTTARSHRQARLVYVPGTITPVGTEYIEAVAALLRDSTATNGGQGQQQGKGFFAAHGAYTDGLGVFPMEDFLQRNGLRAGAAKAYLGGQKWQIDCPFNADHKSPDAMLSVSANGAPGFQCLHNSCAEKDFRALAQLLNDTEALARFEKKPRSEKGDRGDGQNRNSTPAVPILPDTVDFTGIVPRPLTRELLPVLPLRREMLPESLAPWVFDIAERGCFPVEYVAAAAMVALSSLVGRQVGIQPKQHDDWLVVPNLWGGIVGPPGVQKTPASSEALKPLHRLEVEAKDAYAREQESFEIQQMIAKAQAESAQAELKKAAREKTRTAAELNQLATEARYVEEAGKPVWRRYVLNDPTVEKVGELLRDNENGLLIYRDELAGFLRNMERQGHESDRAFYLESWTGLNAYTWDRIGRGTTVIPAVCLSVFGTIQPGPLARIIRRGAGEESDGFLPRFQLLVYPDVSPTFVPVDRYPNSEYKNRAYAVFQRLATIDPVSIGATVSEDSRIPYLRFSTEAQGVFDDWRTGLENRLRRGQETPAMLEHLSKYRSLLPSLALLFHLIEGDTGAVSLTALQRGIAWCAFLESHARRVYQSALDGDTDAAAQLAERLRQSLPNPFTYRQAAQKGWAGLSTVDEVERAVGFLEECGWVKTVDVYAGSQGGRPSVQVIVNPVVLGASEKVEIPIGRNLQNLQNRQEGGFVGFVGKESCISAKFSGAASSPEVGMEWEDTTASLSADGEEDVYK